MSNSQIMTRLPLKKIIIISTLALLIVAALYYFLRPKEELPTYITAEAVMGDIEDSVLASGKIKALTSVDVGAQVSGEVTKLFVDVGDVVQAGDVIAQIDQVTQQNELSNAKATLLQSQASLEVANSTLATKQGDVASAKATIATRQAELTKAQSYYNKLQSLVAIDAVSRQEVEDAKAALDVAIANLDAAKIALKNAETAVLSAKADITSQNAATAKSQTDVDTAQKNLGYTRIVAPIAGTVVAVATEQGTTVNANQSAPTIVTLADLSRVRINAQISEADVINIKAGMPAKFNIIGNPDQKFDAVLAGIEPAPESISSTSSTDSAVYYIGYLDVDNRDGKFRIDMTAQVNIVISAVKNVLTIPASAITTENGKHTVKVVGADGQAKPVQVQVGLNNRISAEIKSGLKLGDKVVISDNQNSNTASRNNRPPMM